jgi:hypothetical protein
MVKFALVAAAVADLLWCQSPANALDVTPFTGNATFFSGLGTNQPLTT